MSNYTITLNVKMVLCNVVVKRSRFQHNNFTANVGTNVFKVVTLG